MTKLSFSTMLRLAGRYAKRPGVAAAFRGHNIHNAMRSRMASLPPRQLFGQFSSLASLPPDDLLSVAKRVAGLSHAPARRVSGLAAPVPGELFL